MFWKLEKIRSLESDNYRLLSAIPKGLIKYSLSLTASRDLSSRDSKHLNLSWFQMIPSPVKAFKLHYKMHESKVLWSLGIQTVLEQNRWEFMRSKCFVVSRHKICTVGANWLRTVGFLWSKMGEFRSFFKALLAKFWQIDYDQSKGDFVDFTSNGRSLLRSSQF